MTDTLSQYSIGDWVVHRAYGIGQIKKIEVKPIHGNQVPCFRVNTKDGAFWFPKDRADNPRIRPVARPRVVQRAKRELQKVNEGLDPDRKMWKMRIDAVKSTDDLVTISQLVRDLTLLRAMRKLNQTEENALNHYKDRLLREWSATMNADVETTRLKLNSYLSVCKEQARILNG